MTAGATHDPRLRPYQTDAIDAVTALYTEGRGRVLGVAATGAGKTAIALALARRMGGRTLWITHRDELIGQTEREAGTWWPEASVGVLKAARNDTTAHLVVASVATLARPHRHTQLDPATFGLVIVDEAHHARAQQYRTVLDYLHAGEPGYPRLYGTTATPDRADGQGLGDVFDAVAFNLDIGWALTNGHLADLRARAVDIGLDLTGIKTRAGDFADNEVGARMLKAAAPERIVTEWVLHGENRKTVVFVPTIEVARLTADEFVRAGVNAAVLWGDMDPDARRSQLAAFRAGQLRVVCNAMLLTEGFDDPSIECVVMGRPTKSRALYAQAVGRGLRPYPGKTDCLVLDLVGASHVHSLVTAKDLLGVHELLEGDTAKRALTRKDETEKKEAAETQGILAEDWEYGQRAMVDVDAVGRPPGRKYAWIEQPITGCALRWIAWTDRHVVAVRANTGGRGRNAGHRDHPWIAGHATRNPDGTLTFGAVIATGKLRAVLDKAERWLDGNGGINPDPGRPDGPTPAQLWFLKQNGIDARTWTKKGASGAIGAIKAKQLRSADMTDAWAVQQVRDTSPDRVAEWVNAGGTIADLAATLVPSHLTADAATMLHRQLGVACDRGLVDRTRAMEAA